MKVDSGQGEGLRAHVKVKFRVFFSSYSFIFFLIFIIIIIL